MTATTIAKRLEQALMHGDAMPYGLYKYELEEIIGELKSSLTQDNDDYIFAVTENSGYVAMVLIEKSGQVYINEQAREKLKALWHAAYESNMKKLIPVFAKQLHENELPINGVKQRGLWPRR
jgi:frataxin-like iron-binding protein CyaY